MKLIERRILSRLMSSFVVRAILCLLMSVLLSQAADPDAIPLHLMVVSPGHFHAALLQKDQLPGVAETVHIYAPPGADLNAHVARIAAFNDRSTEPTHWISRIYAGPDYLERMLAERPGNIAIFSGRNAGKIGAIQRVLDAGIHVLGDKPWVIEAADLPKLETALETGRRRHVAAYDMMTQRFEVTNLIQRALVNDPAVFGDRVPGSPEDPAVSMESVHYLLKLVGGQPNVRPAWFFDIRQQGEGLTDVGTHLVDLVQWMLFPDRSVDYRKEIRVLAASRWPTALSLEEFRRVTGESQYPRYLETAVQHGRLEYFCNNSVIYTIGGVHTRLTIRWHFEAPAGTGDTELAVIRGSRSQIDVRQGAAEKFRPEVYIRPCRVTERPAVKAAIERRLRALADGFPGLELKDSGAEFLVLIPEKFRIAHEAHFMFVGRQFLKYVRDPAAMPDWEEPGMLAKYYVTTAGVELARSK
jgi:predicted dehydrogenase